MPYNTLSKFPGSNDEGNGGCNGSHPDLWPNLDWPRHILGRYLISKSSVTRYCSSRLDFSDTLMSLLLDVSFTN